MWSFLPSHFEIKVFSGLSINHSSLSKIRCLSFVHLENYKFIVPFYNFDMVVINICLQFFSALGYEFIQDEYSYYLPLFPQDLFQCLELDTLLWSKEWRRKHAKNEEGKRKVERMRRISPGIHFHLTCAFITTHFPLTLDFFPLTCVVDFIIALKYMLPTLIGGLQFPPHWHQIWPCDLPCPFKCEWQGRVTF